MDGHLWHDLFMRAMAIMVHAAFPAIVFVISSKITFRELLEDLRQPRLLFKAFFTACVLIPLLTAAAVKYFAVPPLIGGIILLAAAAPGDSFALLEVKSKRGKISMAAVMMALLCLAMPLTLPVWMIIFGQWFSSRLTVSPLDIFLLITPLTVLPLLAGVTIRTFFPAPAAMLRMLCEWFSRCALLVLSIGGLIIGVRELSQFNLPSLSCIFTAVSLAIVIGYYAGGAERRNRITLGLTASLGNIAAVFLIAHASYPHLHVLAPAVAFIILRWLVIMFWYLVLRTELHLRGEPLPPDEGINA